MATLNDGLTRSHVAVAYAQARMVLDRPIEKNRGIQFPLAKAYMAIEAANLMRWRACLEYDLGHKAGANANMAK